MENQSDVVLETINHNGHLDYIVKRTLTTGNITTELLLERFNTKHHSEKERLIDYYDNGKVIYQLNNDVVNSTIKTSNGEYFMAQPVVGDGKGLSINNILEDRANLVKYILCGKIYVALILNGNTVIEDAKCLDLSYDNDGITEVLIYNSSETHLSENFKDLKVQVAVKYDDSFIIVIPCGVVTQVKCDSGNIKYAIISNLNIPHVTSSLQIPQDATQSNIEINVKL